MEVKRLLSTDMLDMNCEVRDDDRTTYIYDTPLCVASEKGHKDVVQLLLDRGADPNKADKGRWTPLHEAALRGHKDVVQLLLARGADPHRTTLDSQDTPLRFAQIRGHKNVVKILRDHVGDA